ncbi:hypothetical protein FXO38_33773 [Capsicum annuum]|nr:hypothetical protein FXO38_33773 [Capsicum annuum]
MEDSDKLWSDRIPPDILGSIASRLVVGEYFVFRVVCKQWRLAPLMPPSHRPRRLHDDLQLPYLMTLHEKTGIVEFFDPVYNVVTTHNPDSRCVTSTEGGSTPYLQNSFNFQGLHPRLLIKLLVANFLMEGARSCKRELAKSSHFLCSWIN